MVITQTWKIQSSLHYTHTKHLEVLLSLKMHGGKWLSECEQIKCIFGTSCKILLYVLPHIETFYHTETQKWFYIGHNCFFPVQSRNYIAF